LIINSNCAWWYDVTDRDIGETICVQGVVDSIIGNTENADARIYFRDLPALFYFLDEEYYYPDLEVGYCVSARGRISVNESGVLFMRITDGLQACD
jgi:hypothetical protein